MMTNVGNVDRLARVILGIAILATGAYFRSWWGLLGFGPLTTATLRWCPAYIPFKLNTCSKAEAAAEAASESKPA